MAAVCLFTLTCSHRPILVCFVSATNSWVAPKTLICSLLLSKCSARTRRLFLRSDRAPEFRVASHAVNSNHLQSTQARLSVVIGPTLDFAQNNGAPCAAFLDLRLNRPEGANRMIRFSSHALNSRGHLD